MYLDHPLHWKRLLSIAVVVTMGISYFMAIFTDFTILGFFSFILKFSGVSALLGIGWNRFEKLYWNRKWFQEWLVTIPDLNGRWEGTRESTANLGEREGIALEITQTLTQVNCKVFREGGRAISIIASLIPDEHKTSHRLIFVYHHKCDVGKDQKDGDNHDGVFMLRLIHDTKLELHGEYVNDRNPPRKADVKLEFKSKSRKDKF